MVPSPRLPARLVLVAALATLLFAGALRAFFASIYYHNLTSLGLNATALFSLALLAPVAYLAPVLSARPRRVVLAGILVLGAARIGMGLTRGTLGHLAFAGIAAAAFLVLLPAFLRTARGEGGDDGPPALALGIALGWAADAGILLLGGSFDPTATPLGLLAVAPIAGALAWFAWQGRPVDAWPGRDALPSRGRLALAGLAIGALVFLENAVLGAPHALARWGPHPLWATALGTLAGLLGGALLLARPARPAMLLPALNALGLLAVLDHGQLHTPLAPLLLVAAQAALVLDLAALCAFLSRGTLRQTGLALAWGALAVLVLHFLAAFAFTFAYVPLGGLWKGAERWIPAAAFLLVVLGAVATGRDAFVPAPLRAAPPRRLAALLAVALLVVPMAALALPAAPVTSPAEGEPVRVLTFNLHQGFNNAGAVDPEIFVDVLREADADVVALQESDTARFTSANLDVMRIAARRLGYHEAYGPATHQQGVGLGLLSRLPIRDWTVHALPSGADNRFLLEARLDDRGEDLWVYVVHLALSQADRVAETDVLLARATLRAPRIVAGDLNSCPGGICPDYEGPRDDVYARVTATHRDGWVQATGRNASDPAAFTYDAPDPYERIDYILVSEGLTVTRYETIRTAQAHAASDHLPVLAVVTRA